MNAASKNSLVDQIAAAVLYEGYILYPYRPSLKNQQRWTFGGVFPRAYCEIHQDENCTIQTECLLKANQQAALTVQVRFLQLVDRQVVELSPPLGSFPPSGRPQGKRVPSLTMGPEIHQSWQEAVERQAVTECALQELLHAPQTAHFAFNESEQVEPLWDPQRQRYAGAFIRSQQPLSGTVQVSASRLDEELWKITARITNQAPLQEADRRTRDEALMQSMASTHAILTVDHGQFISMIDPPARLQTVAADCENQGLWPVLVGEPGEADALLSAPIVLYDYPQIAPESPGDLFDATEIDEILSLRVMTLTEEEKLQMASVEQQARSLLQRTEALTPENWSGLHGTLRAVGPQQGGTTQ